MKRETTTEPSNADVEAAYDEYVMPIWKSLNVPVERASNCTLEDFEGTEYLDLFSASPSPTSATTTRPSSRPRRNNSRRSSTAARTFTRTNPSPSSRNGSRS